MRKKGIGVGDVGIHWENCFIDYFKILNESIGTIGFFDRQDRQVIWEMGRPEKTPS